MERELWFIIRIWVLIMSILEKKEKKDKEKIDLSDIDLDSLRKEKEISEEKLKIIEADIKGKKPPKEALKATEPLDRSLETPVTGERAVKAREEFEKELPKWVNAPWMYITPRKEQQMKSWLESWGNVLLDYSKFFVKHIININDLRKEYPFQNKKINKALTLDQIRKIVDYLVEKGLARWLNEKIMLRVRVYWRTNEEWADIMLEYLLNTGRIVEVLSLFDLTQLNQEWSYLPREDLVKVCQILVDRGIARWYNKQKTIIGFDTKNVF